MKYALEWVAAASLSVPCLPLLLLIALAVKLADGGPIFFVQERPGLGARPFRCFKFRTMVPDADRHLDASGVPTRNRITSVGRLLRATSLDELPQLFNVLRLEMTLVGPRPVTMLHLARLSPEQFGRFRMKPGITGLAQVRGRNTLLWSQRIALDNFYIDHHSLFLDVTILVRTIPVVLLRRGIVLDRNPHQVDDLGPPRAKESEA